MLTVEIKINGRVIEVIEVVQMPTVSLGYEENSDPGGKRRYQVNGVLTVDHYRRDGHRVLARKALNAVKKMKR